jgi:type I restriction-modification system DNA methylase subunit/predicted type IV restriction endonuclease
MEKEIMKKLKELVNLDVDKYVRRSGEKVEENVKIKLTLPLLQLLGYDVQKDMDFEHHVRNKRADIALMFEGKPKLIVETKDLDEGLDNHIDQALDYAFKKGVDWVVLTNGVEIRLYKSFISGISPADRKIFSTHLKELSVTFKSLQERISKENLKTAEKLIKEAEEVRENITANILVKDLAECKKRLFLDLLDQFKVRYKSDIEFKKIIDNWADRVSMNLDDPKLIDKLCVEGAYTLINRVLFLRICEDKGHIKPKLTKDSLKKWKEMVEKPSRLLGLAFSEIADRFEGLYKSPLFDDIKFEDVKWNDDTVNFILYTLGEHDFGKITKDILGRAYEQHISKEERKELGQFYTPDFVVDYILDRVELSLDKKILDPACGSGGFLIKAYDRLRDFYRKEGWAEDKIHNEILSKNLFGIDINPFATQLTVMNLFLKDLEHPTSNISIVEGDSLERLENSFDLDYFHKESPLNKITKSDKKFSHSKVLKVMPFDAVIGNPPYISFGVRGSRDTAQRKKALLERLREKYPNSAEYKISLYAVFMQRGIELLKPGGKFGFIVPDSFLLGRYFSKLRRYILNTCAIEEIALFNKDFWKYGIVGRPVIIILRKELDEKKRKENKLTARLYSTQYDIQKISFKSYSYEQNYFENTLHNRFRLFFDKESKVFVEQLERKSRILGGEKGIVSIHTGIRSKIGQKKIVGEAKKGVNWKRGLISGGQINRYSLKYEGHFINIEPELLWSGGWDPEIIQNKKLLLRKTGDSLITTYDDKGYYHLDNLHSIVLKDRDCNLKYILSVLNSNLMNKYYKFISLESGRVMAQTDIETIEQLPIRSTSKEKQKEIARLVDKILLLNEQLNKTKSAKESQQLKSQIEEIDQKIEEKIKKIYEVD